MHVFLDTNVIVSGFATRGLSADVIRIMTPRMFWESVRS